MKYRAKRNEPLTALTGSPVVGKKYHVNWASRGVVGICVDINSVDRTVTLMRPEKRTLFLRPVKWEELRHTRKEQFKKKRK